MTGGDPKRPGPGDSPDPASARRPLSPRTMTFIALVAVGATALADSTLAAQNFTLALIYIPPLLALAWLAGWRFAAACTLLAAVTNFAVDATLGGAPNTLLVHAGNLALFILCVPAERGAATLRFMLEYTRRGEALQAATRGDPIRLGARVMLVPVSWREEAAAMPAQTDDVLVLLEHGQALSASSRPTTVLCVGLLEQFVKPGDHILHLACGNGILSLAALKLGAATALAADAHSASVQATLANARLNDLAGHLEARLGSLPEVVGPLLKQSAERFNLTVCDSAPDVIAAGLKTGLGQTVAPGGVLIVSGFKPEHEARTRQALDEAGLVVIERREQAGWLALASQHRPAL